MVVPYKRIATEEAFATKEQFRLFGKLLDSGYDDPGFKSLWGFYLRSEAERPVLIRERLLNLDARRIADMDATGIDMQLLLFTAPGRQPARRRRGARAVRLRQRRGGRSGAPPSDALRRAGRLRAAGSRPCRQGDRARV